jgi:hypothetical protein
MAAASLPGRLAIGATSLQQPHGWSRSSAPELMRRWVSACAD